MNESTTPGPLDGITVLDFSRVLAAPMATQILAEQGATVIKVERPGGGDETRSFEPRLPHGESAYFFAFNRGKRSVTLDLKDPRGRDAARRLAARADIVVENFLPGAMARLGLGYDDLSAANPGLVYISATGFGQSGPDRLRKGYDTVFQALSGVMAMTGEPDGPPSKTGIPVADMTSGLWIAIAALTGLAGRGVTGRGRHFDVSMMDVQLSLHALNAARLFALDEDPVRTGTQHPGRVPSAAFRTADGGWLHISGSDQHWSPLCSVLGLAELGADPDLRHNTGRVAQRDRVMDALRTAIAGRDREPLLKELRAADVPAGEIRGVREALTAPQAQARGVVTDFEHPTEGTFKALRTPLRETGGEPVPAGTPPLLGADTETVLAQFAGLDDREIEGLRAAGVI
ncbi:MULTISPECIES: CaiB/BaiF CoA transferase family protein [unclassified Streptomyces]|uniref:CaiB/BaiF CoA transferase family protein n=1 Tax=unclassified Streptomyces TaxID=2593676 RepID=UPI0022538ADE|nr:MULTISPECIES: CaiB/BaiF CoA-transferase family protein [unclassified Streptomyces]WSP53061.1 CoA transferase [Streptomyces sp. NBC_01241]MCX4791782.1 CoA transferase [Streptomyces sp. NBC_01221]MCX4799389.1 CoA transferase [Streptomyces sp. NBC_01242]WSJ40741.1 CoA transferase [Streptomyces sp. NBC_01321]WSP59790.1 CoA transferase [Streptomyces sp. NBC_01241]